MSRISLVLALVLLPILASACSLFGDSERDRLEANRRTWNGAKTSLYSYRMTRSCFCPTEITEPSIVTVRDGRVVGVRSAASGVPTDTAYYSHFMTIDGLFDYLSSMLENADNVAVTYDPTYGYPTKITVDYAENAMDDEMQIEASGFAPGTGEPGSQKRELWRSKGLRDYDYLYRLVCFCLDRGQVRIKVRDGVVTEVRRVENDSLMDRSEYRTIDGLFDWLDAEMARQPDTAMVTYDPTYGYPKSAYIDYSHMIADEEMGFAVEGLEPK